MSNLFGILNLNDTDRVFASTVGQEVLLDAIHQLTAEWNEEIAQSKGIFVEKQTDAFKLRYKLPATGKMAEVRNQAPGPASKSHGHWDVALPIKGFAEQLGGGRVDWGYMTLQDLDRHLQGLKNRLVGRTRWEILHAIFDNVNATFADPLHGNLTICRLANTDGSVYPPVVGSETEADDEHYLEAGYTVANISTANMPVKTLRDELVEHFGGLTTGGDPILILTTATIGDKLKTIAAAAGTWNDLPDQYVKVGDDTDILLPRGMPNAPGYCIGRLHSSWIFVWEWMPATYMIAVHLGASAPLLERIDPADTGLGVGLQLVAKWEGAPLSSYHYESRFGMGAGNRLSAAVMEVADGGTYTIPTDFD